MMTRIVLLVLDGFGIGALPDAESYGDAGCNTLQRLAAISKGLTLPNLEQLGLGHLGQFQGIRPMVQPEGCFGMLGFATKGKNSLSGHWELAGYVIEAGERPCETFTAEVTTTLEAALGQKTGQLQGGEPRADRRVRWAASEIRHTDRLDRYDGHHLSGRA